MESKNSNVVQEKPAQKKLAEKRHAQKVHSKGLLGMLKKFLSSLGPGLVTGAADDDPSGILTYTQAGAQFGVGQLWTAVFMLPLLIAIQEMAARVGVVTNKGIARIMRDEYSRAVLYIIVLLLLVANTINLGADLGALAAVSQLIVPLHAIWYLFFFFALIVTLEVYVPYVRYAKILKWLTISLFAYFITGFMVAQNWRVVLLATFIPHFEFNAQFLFIIVGVVGTTISPYMFFWQASQEIEERQESFVQTHRMPPVTKRYLANMRIDTFTGMLFSEIATWFILITTAAVLHTHGITNVTTAKQAAAALEPLVRTFPHAGKISELLFAFGIIGTGLLSIPIFAASSSYAVAEIFSWKEGLSYKLKEARGFYGVIIAGMVVGLLLNFFGVNPIKALVYTAVLNGIVAVPIILMLIFISTNKKIMGKHTSGPVSQFFSWVTFLGMAGAAVMAVYSLFK